MRTGQVSRTVRKARSFMSSNSVTIVLLAMILTFFTFFRDDSLPSLKATSSDHLTGDDYILQCNGMCRASQRCFLESVFARLVEGDLYVKSIVYPSILLRQDTVPHSIPGMTLKRVMYTTTLLINVVSPMTDPLETVACFVTGKRMLVSRRSRSPTGNMCQTMSSRFGGMFKTVTQKIVVLSMQKGSACLPPSLLIWETTWK